MLAAVAAGGVVGVALRVTVGMVLPAPEAIPWATLLANLTGSLCLGYVLARRGRRTAVAPTLNAFLTTGVLGSFTTYSAFTVEAHRLAALRPGLGAAYVAVTLGGGVAAASIGLRLGRR